MPILRESTSWRLAEPGPTRRRNDLTEAERANVRAALKFLRARFGGYAPLARVMGLRPDLVRDAAMKSGRPSAALVIRLAATGASIDDVLTGRFPPTGRCPYCGRG